MLQALFSYYKSLSFILHPREIKDRMVPQGHQEKLDLEYVKDDAIQ